MKRLIVLGGHGMFGRTAVAELRALGLAPLVASRRPAASLRVDAEDPASLRAAFAGGDLVIDAAGPFHARSTALVEAACEIGFDVIDISDDLGYAQRLLDRANAIDRAGILVLNACSSVSAVSAFLVAESGVEDPVRATGFLVPATRRTGNPASALALIRSVGRPIRARRAGELTTLRGWSEGRRLALRGHAFHGRLFESADAIHLPRRWPGLARVDLFVDTNTPGLNTLLRVAARLPPLRRLLERGVALGARLSRLLGSAFGAFAYEVEARDGRTATLAVLCPARGQLIPVAPAVLAARRIAEGRFEERGLVPPDRQVDPVELRAHLESHGIEIERVA